MGSVRTNLDLVGLLGAPLARSLEGLRLPSLPGPRELEALEEQLALSPSVELRRVGSSSAGRPIRMLSLGTGPRSVLAWGYPHPDEPLGAAALAWWAQEVAAGAPDGGARWHLVLCADPDMAALNERWIRGGTLTDFVYGAVRPEHLAREVDYGFPVDSGLFYQPEDWDGARACHSAGACVDPVGCGPVCRRHGEPPGPLAESLALAEAIRISRPDLVASMHDTHTGGCFTFLLGAPDADLAARMVDSAGACGQRRHLGVKIDPGLRWRSGVPDLIREPTLADEERRFRRRHAIAEGVRYLGNVSASQFLEGERPGAQFIVPEAAHFTAAAYGDPSPLGEERPSRAAWRQTRRGARFCLFSTLEHHDGSREEIMVRMSREADGPVGEGVRPVSLGWLGAEAVARRRRAFTAADAVWASLPARLRESAHPVAAERRGLGVPGRVVNDRSLLIFRVAAPSARPATVAEAWDLRYRWAIHGAVRVGGLARFLEDEGGPDEGIRALRGQTEALIHDVPCVLRSRSDPSGAARSQLARVLIALDALG